MEEEDLERQAQAIADDWGVSTDLLRESEWTLDSIDGNEGDTHAYLVRFEEDTDAEILSELGIQEGEFERRVSLNAFDEPEQPEPEADWDDSEEEYYRAASAKLTFQLRSSPAMRREYEERRIAILSKTAEIEAVLASDSTSLPPRTHNNPPEAIAFDSLTPTQIAQVREIVQQVRSVTDRPVPDPSLLNVTGKWVLSKLDRAVNAGIDSGAPIAMVAVAASVWEPLRGMVRDLALMLQELAAFLQNAVI